MEWKRGTMLLLGSTFCLVAIGDGIASALPEEKATRVTLSRRADNGPYGKSAYSFRYRSQDVDEHRNEVDLLFKSCGNLHVSASSAANRVALTAEKKLSQVTEFPEEGWQTTCFAPEKSAVYVMQVEDAAQRFSVKFRIIDAKQDRVVLEWLPMSVRPESERGTEGQCGGPHACDG